MVVWIVAVDQSCDQKILMEMMAFNDSAAFGVV